jgi:hypothetical protein
MNWRPTSISTTRRRDKPLDREQLRSLMKARVDQANDEIADAQKAIRDANAALIKAQQRHARLVGDYNRRFPPMSPAQNIKQHLAAHMERKLAALADGNPPSSQVDRAMGQSRKVGWNRPARPVGFGPQAQ